jgi:photosystem II CP47 chlorophyll apoprotein
MVRGDGLVIGWLGHPVFRLADNTQVYARRMPSFFETFPTLFVDATGVVRADQPFRRAAAKYAIEGVGFITILGEVLAGIELDGPSTGMRQEPFTEISCLGWKLMQPHWLSSGCSERLGTLRPHGG